MNEREIISELRKKLEDIEKNEFLQLLGGSRAGPPDPPCKKTERSEIKLWQFIVFLFARRVRRPRPTAKLYLCGHPVTEALQSVRMSGFERRQQRKPKNAKNDDCRRVPNP